MRLHGPLQEETGTLIILYAVERLKTNPFKERYVMYPDTDVLLNLLYHCCVLCNKILLITIKNK